MQGKKRTAVCFVMLLVILSAAAFAKNTKTVPAAPVPPQITAAKKIFIANLGQDSYGTVADGPLLNGSANRTYDEFYAAMKDWNHYELVSSPANADLIFEISWTYTDIQESVSSSTIKAPTDLGRLKLTIIDPATHVPLWGFQEHVRDALLQSNREKNFEQGMADIVSDVKSLVSQAPGAPTGTTANQ